MLVVLAVVEVLEVTVVVEVVTGCCSPCSHLSCTSDAPCWRVVADAAITSGYDLIRKVPVDAVPQTLFRNMHNRHACMQGNLQAFPKHFSHETEKQTW